MVDFYDVNALSYFEQTVSVDPKEFLAPFVERLPPGAKVLDVGCGSGRDLLWLLERGFKVKGLERSSALAEMARKHTGCEVVVVDFDSWDFAESPVEGIVLVGTLVHTQHKDFERILNRITRGLVPNGKVLLTLKEGEGLSKAADGRVFYLWKDGSLRGLLTEFGFKILYFDRLVSAILKEDIWLTYVLEIINGGVEPS